MESTRTSAERSPRESVARPIEDVKAQLKSTFRPRPFPYRSRYVLHGETKWLQWDFSKAPFKTLELIQITDMQWGHVSCKIDRVREYRDWVLRAPNRFMIWTGDNVDAATLQSKGTPYENRGTPQDQVFEFCQEWASARHRILGYVGGNHERRSIPTYGDLGIQIAADLEIPYSRGKQLIDVTFGKHKPFQISQWHGMGSAVTKGAIAQKLARFATEGDSNIYLMGHHHQAMVLPFWKERRGQYGMRAVKTIAAAGTSFLETWGSYGEVAGFAPSDVLMPRIVLGVDGDWELTLK